MSTFIDIQLQQKETIDAPTRTNNGPWQRESVAHPIFKFESWALNAGPQISDLYHEGEATHCTVWILGEVYSYRNIRLRDGRIPILNLIVTEVSLGKFDPAQMNGHFVMIVYQAEHKIWRVYTNRLGTFHMYYGKCRGRNVLGTFYRSVAANMSSTTMNEEALQGYFSCGFFLNDATFFKEITILKGASVYTFNEELTLIDVLEYWKPVHEPMLKNYSDAIDRFAEVIKEVTIDLTTGGRVAIPISGGLDSRTMAGVCTLPEIRNQKQYWSYSYGYSADSIETQIAEKIAKARHLSFTRKIIGNYLFQRLDEVADSVELFQYIDGTRQADIVSELAQHSDYVIAAHWGDVWLDSMGVQTGLDLSAQALKKFKKNGSDWLISNVLHKSPDHSSTWVKETLAAQLNNFSSVDDPDFKMKLLKTTQWSFRWTLASIRMFQQGAFPRLPFYDNRVVDLFASIPTNFLCNRNLQIDYLKRYHPDLAAIRWQEFGANLFQYKYFNNRQLPYRVVSKLQRMMKGTKFISRNWELFYLNAEGNRHLTANLMQGSRLSSWVSPGEVQKLLDEFYRNPNGTNGYSISMLHTFAIFLKRYLR